jgi:exodeoxyribonuclease VII small subunit
MPNSKKSAATASTATVDPAIDPVSRFEGSLKELEAIVARMERGDLPLEESLIEFERGMKLSRDCRASLESAELRVKNLLDADRDAADPEADA